MAGRKTLTREESLAFNAPCSQLVGETLLGFCKAGDVSAALQWLKWPGFTDGASLESTTLYVFTHKTLENKINVDRIHLGRIPLYCNKNPYNVYLNNP